MRGYAFDLKSNFGLKSNVIFKSGKKGLHISSSDMIRVVYSENKDSDVKVVDSK